MTSLDLLVHVSFSCSWIHFLRYQTKWLASADGSEVWNELFLGLLGHKTLTSSIKKCLSSVVFCSCTWSLVHWLCHVSGMT